MLEELNFILQLLSKFPNPHSSLDGYCMMISQCSSMCWQDVFSCCLFCVKEISHPLHITNCTIIYILPPFSFSFHSLCTVTPSAKAAFQGAVKNVTILNLKCNIYNKSKYPNYNIEITEEQHMKRSLRSLTLTLLVMIQSNFWLLAY